MKIRVDKRMLVDSFTYHKLTGKDNKHQPTYADGVLVSHCRIDHSQSNYRSKEEDKSRVYAVIFCYPGMTSPALDFKERAKVVFDGEEHIIQRIVTVTQPYSSDVFAYEIEVV